MFYNFLSKRKDFSPKGQFLGFITLHGSIFFLLQFDLICDKSSLAELIQTLVMAGQLVGAAFASSFSDRFGRKTVHLCSNLMILILGISVAFAPNYTTLAIMKFILGVFQQVS